MDFIVDEPWGIFVLMGFFASLLWITVWSSLWLGGKFDGLWGKGVPVLLLGFLLCIPFGAIVLGLALTLWLAVVVIWLANMAFGWFGYQMLLIRQVFTKSASSADDGEDAVASKKSETE